MTVTTELLSPGGLSPARLAALWDLVVAVDEEFVPSLSSRNDTTTKRLSDVTTASEPVTYYRSLLGQWTIFADVDGRTVGFLSFIQHHHDTALAGWTPCSYVSTIAVVPSERRRGIARHLYGALAVAADRLGDPNLATRTWSTNDSHLTLLAELGFIEAARLADHRGPGIDTLYLARQTRPQP
jgi:ribosomal protein S18 acetylase RimI-like enzyme